MDTLTTNPCIRVYNLSDKQTLGTVTGVCRITGLQGTGLNFNSWVKDTFTDIAYLKPGTIICNEAIFCFHEASEYIQKKVGKDKPQRFRTYSHIIHKGLWYCLTKADKKQIFDLITDGADLVCLTDTGQKHLLFKHKSGMWQLDETFITPNIKTLKYLHTHMCSLMCLGFAQGEIISGKYDSNRLLKAGIENWKVLENSISPYRGSAIMNFAGWMLFIPEDAKQKIQESYKKQDKPKPVTKTAAVKTTKL
jgi:hypothetical protein